MRAFFAAVQRPSATGSPARWSTASTGRPSPARKDSAGGGGRAGGPAKRRTPPRAPRARAGPGGADSRGGRGRYAARRLDELAALGLDGFVLKSKSPSCGPAGVKLYAPGVAEPLPGGVGRFAAALAARLPALPVVDETQLH